MCVHRSLSFRCVVLLSLAHVLVRDGMRKPRRRAGAALRRLQHRGAPPLQAIHCRLHSPTLPPSHSSRPPSYPHGRVNTFGDATRCQRPPHDLVCCILLHAGRQQMFFSFFRADLLDPARLSLSQTLCSQWPTDRQAVRRSRKRLPRLSRTTQAS